MVCREVEQNELVAKYVSGRLDPTAQDDFEIHILECESCRTSVEILHVVREDLVARAHEIRAYSPKPRGGLRLRWVTIPAMCVLVFAGGVLQWARLRHRVVQTVQVQLPADNREAVDAEQQKRCVENPSAAGCMLEEARVPHVENGNGHARKGTSADGLSVASQRAGAASVQADRAQHTQVGAISDLPVYGRNYIDFEKAEQRSQQEKPENIAALLDKLKLPQSLAQDKDFAAELRYLESQVVGTRDIAVASDGNKITARELAADDVLNHLASVQPPPYAFSGVAGTKHSNGTPNSVVTGGVGGADLPGMAQTLFHDAMLAYAEKRYSDAETLLRGAVQSAPGSADVNFYLGICRLLGDRANEAIEPLQFVLTKEDSPYLQSAHFYLGKAYLQMRDMTRAQAELESATAMPGRLTAVAASTLARLRSVLVFQSEEQPQTIKTPDKKN